jgi:putative tricarboxylic transport membrane protein
MIMASFASLIVSLSFVKGQVKILLVPRFILMPIVFVLCVMGSYAINVRVFDIWVMMVFGVIGYVMRKYYYPAAPLVLGVILGDMADVNLRRGLIRGEGDITPFFTRPIALILVFLIILVTISRTKAFRSLLSSIKTKAKKMFTK